MTYPHPHPRYLLLVMGCVVAMTISAGIISACSAPPAPAPRTVEQPQEGVDTGKFHVSWVELGDGTKVRCISYVRYREGGLSCDWAKAVKS